MGAYASHSIPNSLNPFLSRHDNRINHTTMQDVSKVVIEKKTISNNDTIIPVSSNIR